jgi:hypothetical protein
VESLRRLVSGRDEEFLPPHCPVTERACAEEGVWLTQNMLLGSKVDMDDIADAIAKIHDHAGEIIHR